MLNFFNQIINNKKFPKKKVLILEGGGMRGIFSTGVLQAFSDRNYFPWKLMIGTSAGALTAAAYGANQIHIARDSFFTELLTGNFIKLVHIMNSQKSILNLDWMIETILKGDEPLDEVQLRKNTRLIITATNFENFTNLETIYLDAKKEDIITSLKASAALPYLYKGFVKYKNYNFLDGGLLDPIPYKKALSMGYKEKDILIILTRPRGYRKKNESFWVRAIYESYYKNPEFHFLVKTIQNRYKQYNAILDEIEKSNIDVIYTPKNFKVTRLSQDSEKILQGFEQGVNAAKEFLFK